MDMLKKKNHILDASMMMLLLTLFLMNIPETLSGSIKAAEKMANLTGDNYNKKVRPFADGPPVNVSLQLAIVAFGPVNEKDFTFKVDIFLRLWWYDDRLEGLGNDTLNYNGDPSEIIWVVDAYIPNARETKPHKGLTPNTRTKLGPNGNVFVSTRLTAICSCAMDLHVYPMDSQKCTMLIESYSYTGYEVMLMWVANKEPIEFIPGSMQMSGYEFKGIEEDYIIRIYGTGEMFPLLKASFKVKRTFSYYFYRSYLSTSLLVILTWSTFWIPDKAVPARVTLIVTMFLATAFILQGASTTIPKVAYTTALDVYLFTNVIFIMSVLGEYLLVLNFYQKKEVPIDSKEITAKQNGEETIAMIKETEVRTKRSIPTKKQSTISKIFRYVFGNNCHVIDGIARIAFPSVYALFIITYMCYYSARRHAV